MIRRSPWLPACLGLLLLAGCAGRTPESPERDGAPTYRSDIDLDRIPDAVPRPEPRSPYGNPPTYAVFGQTYRVMPSSAGYVERGIASWYGTKFHGRRTSSGEPYDLYAMTAAHKSLPLPTYVRVTNLENGRSIVVKVNDRGPFHDNRVIDLSYAGAYKLGMLGRGTAKVEVRAIDPRRPQQLPPAPPAPPPGHAPDIFLQAGAFASEQNAQRFRARLERALARQVRIQPITQPQPLYRVQIGPLASVEQADVVTTELRQLGVNGVHVVLD